MYFISFYFNSKIEQITFEDFKIKITSTTIEFDEDAWFCINFKSSYKEFCRLVDHLELIERTTGGIYDLNAENC